MFVVHCQRSFATQSFNNKTVLTCVKITVEPTKDVRHGDVNFSITTDSIKENKKFVSMTSTYLIRAQPFFCNLLISGGIKNNGNSFAIVNAETFVSAPQVPVNKTRSRIVRQKFSGLRTKLLDLFIIKSRISSQL